MSGQLEYSVGDVLYVFDSDKQRIVPVQVVSVTSKRTINGVEVSHEIVTPARTDRPVDIARVHGEIYTSLTDLRQFMMENAKRAIDSMVQRAADVAMQAFDPPEIVENNEELALKPPVSVDDDSPAPPGTMRVHMPDGTVEYVDAGEQLSV